MTIIKSIKLDYSNHLRVTAFPLADANGNAVTYLDKSGNVQAHYTYDAFGGAVSSDGEMADDFRFRFSSKYLDDETGLFYYGVRYYSTTLGSWLNRDSIGEKGGVMLYGFIGNDAINYIDKLGMKALKIKVEKCQAILVMGHGSKTPIDWRFPVKNDENECAMGGALCCFPEDNNPICERRWPKTPRHNGTMGRKDDTDKTAATVLSPGEYDGPINDPEDSSHEQSIGKSIKNALSKDAVRSILDQLCEDCPEVTFIFRTTSKNFGWDRYMGKIKKETGMNPLQEKRRVLSCCQDPKDDKAIDLKEINDVFDFIPEYIMEE